MPWIGAFNSYLYSIISSSLDYQCIGRTNGNKERTDNNCRSYLSCNNYSPLVVNCPSNWYFDSNTRVCVDGGSRNNPPLNQGCVGMFYFSFIIIDV